MTLATRCSACGTSFRVVQDQLKVSGGWVRCGRCNEVFNALESLYEIEVQPAAPVSAPQAPPPPAPPQPPPAPPPVALPPPPTAVMPSPPAAELPRPAPATSFASLWGRRKNEAAAPPPVEADAPAPPASQAAAAPPAVAPMPAVPAVPVAPVAPTSESAEPGAVTRSGPVPVQEPAWVPFGGVWPSAAESSRAASVSPSTAPAASWSVPGAGTVNGPASVAAWSTSTAEPSEPAEWDDRPVHGFEDVETRLEPRAGEDVDIGPTPSFLRQTQQMGLPEKVSGGRRAWTVAAGALGLLLGLQFTLAWRDTLAARVPALEPVLSIACVPFACTVNAPRNLAAMALEGSNLRQRGGVGSGYDFVVSLRNRSSLSVMWPAFELTLTDSQGQPLMRRVLLIQDFGVRDSRLGPAAEINLTTQLDVSDRRIAGYTVEIFYP